MKLKLKFRLNVYPDKNGEFTEEIGKRLIAAGLAELETASIDFKSEKRMMKKEKRNA